MVVTGVSNGVEPLPTAEFVVPPLPPVAVNIFPEIVVLGPTFMGRIFTGPSQNLSTEAEVHDTSFSTVGAI